MITNAKLNSVEDLTQKEHEFVMYAGGKLAKNSKRSAISQEKLDHLAVLYNGMSEWDNYREVKFAEYTKA